MPSKKVAAKDALKKTKKNFKKVFTEADDHENYTFLNSFIGSKKLRELINVYEALTLNELDADLDSSKFDLFGAIRDVLEDLILVSEHNDDAAKLTNILTSVDMKAYVEAVSNVSTRQYIPQINIMSVVKASSLHSLKSDPYENISRSLTDVGGTLPSLHNDPYSFSTREDPNIYVTENDIDEQSSMMDGGVTLVGIPKDKGENLGMTIGIRSIDLNGEGPKPMIVVERVMNGSKIEQRNLLVPGDIITEVNGTIVDSPDLLQKLMKDAQGIVYLKVIPIPRSKQITTQLYLRAFFVYDPSYDTLIPCKEAGLPFMPGDILQVLQQDDLFWWQARHFNAKDRAGLIPTEYLEERRRAYLQNARDPNEVQYKMFGFGVGKRKKKTKVEFSAMKAADYGRSDIVMYEEVTRIPGFKRSIVCLLGCPGVGRSTIRDELLRRFPDRFACPIRDTSREKRPTEPQNKYNFIEREVMIMENEVNRYVDFGELNDVYYGIHLRTIREIIKSGKTCLIDCSPEAAKRLRTAEFMPWILFLAAPSIDCMRAMYEYGYQTNLTEKIKFDDDFHNAIEESIHIEREYRYLFDDVVVVDNMSASFEKILQKFENLDKTPQWIPAKWIY